MERCHFNPICSFSFPFSTIGGKWSPDLQFIQWQFQILKAGVCGMRTGINLHRETDLIKAEIHRA